jgi:hypothetical protein
MKISLWTRPELMQYQIRPLQKIRWSQDNVAFWRYWRSVKYVVEFQDQGRPSDGI